MDQHRPEAPQTLGAIQDAGVAGADAVDGGGIRGGMKIYKRPYPRFALRTIRKGRVKIRGQWFYPWEKWEKYDGRLDKMRYAFRLYYTRTEGGFICKGLVQLWGPEQHFNNLDADKWQIDPQVTTDGSMPWIWWTTKQHLAEGEARKGRRRMRREETLKELLEVVDGQLDTGEGSAPFSGKGLPDILHGHKLEVVALTLRWVLGVENGLPEGCGLLEKGY